MKKKKIVPKVIFLGTSALISVSCGNLSVNAEQQSTIDSTQLTSSLESSTTEKNETTDSTNQKEAQQAKTFQVKEALAATSDVPGATDATNEVVVTNWKEFVTAFKNNTVTSIKFANDIAYGTGGSDSIPTDTRTSSIVIDGNNYTLNMNSQRLRLDNEAPGTPEITVKNLSDVSFDSGDDGFVYASCSYWTSRENSTWTVNFSNIKNNPSQRPRMVNNSGGQVNFTGDVTWYGRDTEFLTASGVKIEDNVTVSAYRSSGNFTFIWFDRAPKFKKTTDVGDDNMVIGKNATLNCRLTGNNPAYPVVFCFYKEFRMEDGATFNGTVPGNAYRADYEASSFIAEGNNKINLTSIKSGYSPIDFTENLFRDATKDRETHRQFYVGPGSEFYVEAATNKSLFTTETIGSLVDITIDNPKILDLNNYSSGTRTDSSSILNKNSIVNSFLIKNSNLTLWTTSQAGNSTIPTGIFNSIELVSQSNGGNTVAYSSSDSGVQSLLPLSNIRRINALNADPTINFIDVTNAQKTIKYETVLGRYPDANGMDEDGHINYINVYPYAGAASADITDTYGEIHKGVPSGEAGITTLQTDKLNQAGIYTSGIAIYGERTQEVPTTYKVWDVVPPDPAVITSKDITEGVSSLSGTGEAGASVYLEIDGKAVDAATTTVDSSGNWTLNFDSSLAKTGSVAQIFLEDHAGQADITNPPKTNNTNGNINPKEDFTPAGYDITFKAATKVTFTKSNFAITANDMTIRAKDYPKTEDDLKALIRENSQATLTNQGTQESLDATLINVDISQLPSPSSEKVTQGKYKVTLSYKRGESTFTKDINVTIADTSKMEIKQVYKGTTDPIYSNAKDKTPVESQTVAVESGGKIEDSINQLVSDKKLTLSYDDYTSPSQASDYKVYQDGKEVTPKPTTVPDGDFTLVYEYEGQLKFGETAQNINFGKIKLSNDTSTTALDDSSDKDIEIIDTIPNGDWTLKAATSEAIKQTDGKKLPYLGSLVYKTDKGDNQTINSSATKIESKQSTDASLYSEINLKDSDQSGLYLTQNGGNLKGNYSGKIVWTLEDSP